ncbi:phospholipase D family protein [Rhizobium mongolense]|uniref:Phospholipase D-like domain-containing protein n=2 Tax=Rhizobium mongolense TaxID=57676 RepID=A0ABR6IN46_9HYPH|nr:phospholipase D family protein [Rhizobium mongolense]MBB4229316.1 hypothetical protein [Rhizobium mongolense]TVZ63136.1 phospholipase D-like protein [Rhizobium mongolense USDA 1844]
MKVEFLNARGVDATLRRLIDEHVEFHWAVAWGSMTGAAKVLLRNVSKIRDVTFGVAFSQTDPDLVAALEGVDRARVATKFSGGTYHPKFYGFRSGRKAAAIVGSANFTAGGLDRNWEAAILVTGETSDPFFVDIFKFTKASADLGEVVTSEFAAAYRASCTRANRLPKPPRNPMEGLRQIKPGGFRSPLISMPWMDYVMEVQSSAHHDIEKSLALLRTAQKWVADVRSFSQLRPEQRKAIAGIIGRNQKNSPDLKQDWGWFGSMKGMGDFANRIDENDRNLARAIDSVPQKGQVTVEHYKKFIRHFEKAFDHSTRMGGVPTASRLLAMKRPDTFICICRPNREEAAARMEFSKTRLTLDNYWEQVVEVIRLSEWYNEDKPDGAEGEIWENRAAMLDTIFYRPS